MHLFLSIYDGLLTQMNYVSHSDVIGSLDHAGRHAERPIACPVSCSLEFSGLCSCSTDDDPRKPGDRQSQRARASS